MLALALDGLVGHGRHEKTHPRPLAPSQHRGRHRAWARRTRARGPCPRPHRRRGGFATEALVRHAGPGTNALGPALAPDQWWTGPRGSSFRARGHRVSIHAGGPQRQASGARLAMAALARGGKDCAPNPRWRQHATLRPRGPASTTLVGRRGLGQEPHSSRALAAVAAGGNGAGSVACLLFIHRRGQQPWRHGQRLCSTSDDFPTPAAARQPYRAAAAREGAGRRSMRRPASPARWPRSRRSSGRCEDERETRGAGPRAPSRLGLMRVESKAVWRTVVTVSQARLAMRAAGLGPRKPCRAPENHARPLPNLGRGAFAARLPPLVCRRSSADARLVASQSPAPAASSPGWAPLPRRVTRRRGPDSAAWPSTPVSSGSRVVGV